MPEPAPFGKIYTNINSYSVELPCSSFTIDEWLSVVTELPNE
ncbi:hypothetical protein [Paenibacillus foliorum]|nr:hypothetical protein [Paenibacillus foliorum]